MIGARGRRLALAAILAALFLGSAAATCRSAEPERTERAVPAEVEIDWPDAAAMPPPNPAPEGEARDAGP